MTRGLRMPTNLWRGLASYLDDRPERMHVELRAELMLESYRRRRDRYRAAAERLNLRYDAANVAALTQKRLQSRGIQTTKRPASEPVHTVAFVSSTSWHYQLLDALRELGPVSHFDAHREGLEAVRVLRGEEDAVAGRRRACQAFEQFVAKTAAERPVDWVFVYASGAEILGDTLKRVAEITKAPVVTMCLDDKQSWDGPVVGEQHVGQVDIAPHFDLAWTSARVACEWYMVERGNPVFMGEGCSPELFRPGSQAQDLDVCFIGQAYGYRPTFIRRLQAAGARVHAVGSGWPAGPVDEAEMTAIMQRSKLILGLGGIGWSEHLKNVKGRDFDGPCVGAYLTSYNPDLTSSFAIGQEIACYSTVDEAAEVTRELLCDDRRREELARRGRERCLADHTWLRRYRAMLTYLGIN